MDWPVDEFMLGWALGDGVDTPLGLGIIKRIASHYTCDVLVGDKIVNISQKDMTVVARDGRIRLASLDNVGFGPDKLPYAEALAREYGKQPALPTGAKIDTRNSARAISPRRGPRYDRHLRKSSPTKEGTMPRKAAAPAVEPEETEKDYTPFATKTVTPVAVALAEWIVDKVGLDLDEEEMELFTRAVYLTNALRRESRQDEANRARTEELREERQAARASTSKAKADEEEGEEEEAPAKAPARGRGKAAATTSTSATSKTGATATAPRRGRQPAASTGGRKPRATAGATKGAAPF